VTRTRRQSDRPRIRLLWDENLSVLVPKALRVLDFWVTYVGSDEEGVPGKKSSDDEVVEYALSTKQVIVTANHDMMTLCAEAGQRFVWLDARGKQLTRDAQVLLVFKQISEWERTLAASPAMCLVARRSGCKLIAPGEAARLATNRMRSLERKARSRARGHQLGALGSLLDDL
jgi:predicted nuclease of predicted toxin-antitoxin system